LDVTHLIKVLHLWKSDSPRFGGGGAASMYRLHTNLRKAGIESKILCEYKTTHSSHVAVVKRWPKIEWFLRGVTKRIGLNDIHIVSSYLIKRHKAYLDSNIIFFRGTHSFINYLALPSLTESKPSIFHLSDLWCLTGHCAISYDCERWKIGCGNCPYLDAYPPVSRDATRWEWRLKNWVYSRSNFTIVAPSRWMAEQAKQSMLKRFPIHRIHPGADLDTYEPLNPVQCRSLLGIPQGKKVLMFSAVALNQYNKGSDLLLGALKGLPVSLKNELVLLLLGDKGGAIAEAADIQSTNLGYVSNNRLKAIAYNAADLFVLPTRAEAFGLVLLESMACGTPVVSFRVGGVTDLVNPGVNGYLAEPENANDLRDGIVQLLENEQLRASMGKMSREIAQKEFSSELEVERYTELFQQLYK